MDKFVKGAQLDAEIIIAEIAGNRLEDLTDIYPLFHAPGIPTYLGAKLLGDWAGIEIQKMDIQRKPTNRVQLPEYQRVIQTCAIIQVVGSAIRRAGISTDTVFGKQIAIGLAYRNAVQAILYPGKAIERPGEGELQI